MEDRVYLYDRPRRSPEEHAPVAYPETKTRLSLDALDVADSRFGVLVDPGKEPAARSRIDSPQVATRPS